MSPFVDACSVEITPLWCNVWRQAQGLNPGGGKLFMTLVMLV